MNSKLDITLTDFIYAIIVGAAFQRIDAPIISQQNIFLLIAFIIIIDDWVLYHLQTSNVPDSKRAFAKSLVIDSSVLLSWYCAAISGSHAYQNGYQTTRDFFLFMGLFYTFTFTWEYHFKNDTGNDGRIIPDFICMSIFLLGSILFELRSFGYIAFIFTLVWFTSRGFAWRRIVFSDTTAT